ncbi:MAG: TonB-dependent receptor [Pseudomonadota bacterium]
MVINQKRKNTSQTLPSQLSLITRLLCLIFTFSSPHLVHSNEGDDHDDHHDHHHDEGHGQGHNVEEIVVQATRSRNRVKDEATRVEVLSQEEIEEKLLMRPGNISMMLNETGGLRVQVNSPALGSANVRIHGMRGRYTQLLADGLPLYGGQASSLGLLQVPPSDLGQVEVIKGSASALYGGQALGGVINLVSKRPASEAEGEVIANATTKDAQDLSAYFTSPLRGGWSGSVLTNYNRQSVQDLDSDDWIDMPGYDRYSIRPRLFYNGSDGSSAYITVGAMTEDRRGGTDSGGLAPNGLPFPHSQETSRFDAGMVFEKTISDWGWAQLRGSGMRQSHDHRFSTLLEKDEHETMFIEASLAGEADHMSWVGGVAYQTDTYEGKTFPVFDYSYESPAVFAQIDLDIHANFSFVGSARWDDHSDFGSQFSPRVSAVYRPGQWTVRASWGRGFYAPTPFVEETEAAGLSRLERVSGLDAETAETVSLDIGYSTGSIETGLTFFGSNIEDALRLQDVAAEQVRLVNEDGITRTRGIEALLRWRKGSYIVTVSYLYLDAREPVSGTRQRLVPLTPRHSAGFPMWEEHGRGRVGLELYYTGEQSLADNPFRSRSKPYLHMGLLGEIVLGRYHLFLNLENLLDVRQTREDSLLRSARTPDGRHWRGLSPTLGCG